MDDKRDVASDVRAFEQGSQVADALLESVGVSSVVGLVGKTAPDVVGRDDPVRAAQVGNESPVHERPRGIAVQHDHGRAVPFIDIVLAHARVIVKMTLERKEVAKRL